MRTHLTGTGRLVLTSSLVFLACGCEESTTDEGSSALGASSPGSNAGEAGRAGGSPAGGGAPSAGGGAPSAGGGAPSAGGGAGSSGGAGSAGGLEGDGGQGGGAGKGGALPTPAGGDTVCAGVTLGSACPAYRECDLDGHPDPACRTRISCHGGVWSLTEPHDGCGPGLPPCSPASGNSVMCEMDGDVCLPWNPEKFACSPDPPQPDVSWPTFGCPAIFALPRLGTPCTPEEPNCPSDCITRVAPLGRLCVDGVWEAQNHTCK
jgi:hypothetical protein